MLLGMNITRELTAVDYRRVNGRVERSFALVVEEAKPADSEFPQHLSDVILPTRALSLTAIWPEACTCMNDCLDKRRR